MSGTAAGNAMGAGVWSDLPGLVTSLDADPSVRAVVLRGAGDCFSVGLDLRWYLVHYQRMRRAGEGHPAFRARLLDEALGMQDALVAITRSRLPFVAAVHGACVGAALELAAACDIRVASADAYFSLREVRIGVIADLGALQRLPRLIGAGATRELALTGRDVPATEAHALGLVTRVRDSAPDLFDHAVGVAALIAANPPQVVAGIKAVCEHTQDLPVAAGMRHTAVWNSAFLPSPELTGLLAGVLRPSNTLDAPGAPDDGAAPDDG
ncbi:enoyl-CoA hydratase [Micromonospora echinofusca]|uniref:Enoyl-CoA hydratase n=2 Tax=Micromonospora echinofusca TaxID=47858 RepID=A0ABS3VJD2_MICEH|nr:enoyl-CoA hydratase [Micromonospora echinofusca]